MSFIIDCDCGSKTIIVIQISGQISLAKDTRDFSEAAEKCLGQNVPKAFLNYLSQIGSVMNDDDNGFDWQTFSVELERAEEIFMVYHLASQVEKLAKVVKDVYPVTTFTTIPLGSTEGMLHGAPGLENHRLWRAFTPCIDLYSPRMLHANYNSVCEDWGSKADQPLLLLAHPQDKDSVRQLWSAFGSYRAFGVATVHIDKVDPVSTPLREHFSLMGQVAPILFAARDQGTPVAGFSFPSINNNSSIAGSPVQKTWGKFHFTVERLSIGSFHGGGCGLVIHQDERKLLAVGYGLQIKAKPVLSNTTFT
ncbi:hypothetical protein LZ31DRAFT_555170 [Colletotrichum somersetense]|nr:hypothetical protein LZ31DRAFT_555170 [Colletotrichum somersetense]